MTTPNPEPDLKALLRRFKEELAALESETLSEIDRITKEEALKALEGVKEGVE